MAEIELYQTRRGECFVKDYLEALLNRGLQSEHRKIARLIDRLQVYGTKLFNDPKMVKKVDGDIWELRPGRHRVLFFAYLDGKFILLHCFLKRTDQTPSAEKEKAKMEMTDYVGQKGGVGK